MQHLVISLHGGGILLLQAGHQPLQQVSFIVVSCYMRGIVGGVGDGLMRIITLDVMKVVRVDGCSYSGGGGGGKDASFFPSSSWLYTSSSHQ